MKVGNFYMYDIIFLGSLFPYDEEKEIYENSIGNMQNAANLLQWDYVAGIEETLGYSIRIMTRMSVGTYPFKYRKPIIKTHVFHHREGVNDLVIGFPNIPIIRQFIYPYVANSHLYKWAKDGNQNTKILIVYSYLYSLSIIRLKKRYPKIRIILILLDLPSYTNLDHTNSKLYNIKKEIETKNLIKSLEYIDGFVSITEYMRDYLDPMHCLNSVVIEGMVRKRKIVNKSININVFQIAYTGTLSEIYGIMDLVNAITSLPDENIRLVICGGGEAANKIKKIAEIDKRIDFRGIVSADEAFKIQCSSNLLVNPRRNNNEYTKFSFPSKLLQYMSSGCATLCCRLDGIPLEYDEYLIYIKENENIADAILRVKKMSNIELESLGNRAALFVLNQKNNIEQTRKILRLIIEN